MVPSASKGCSDMAFFTSGRGGGAESDRGSSFTVSGDGTGRERSSFVRSSISTGLSRRCFTTIYPPTPAPAAVTRDAATRTTPHCLSVATMPNLPEEEIDEQERPENDVVPAELLHDRDEIHPLPGEDAPPDAGGDRPGHLVFIKKIL